MFKIVKYKIAIGNAIPELKNIADKITLSNNEFGVAKALKELFYQS